MVVGKTNTSVSKAEVFNVFSEAEVLSSVFPEIHELPCLISSPLRVDNKPSFSIYMTNGGHIRYNDFATGDKGGLLDLLCRYWNCTFNQCLDKIISLKGNGDITVKPKQIKTFTRKEHDSLTSIQVVVRPWRDYDYEYWASYGISSKWLHWAEIYPISYKIVTKRLNPKDKGTKYVFPADQYAYCFVERKEGKLSLKIYQPFNTKGYKWCSKMDASTVSLWTKVPEYGDKIIVASSVKDALCLMAQLHIPAIAPQGEGYSMSNTAIKELKRRFKKVYVSFDTDKAGKEDAKKFAEETGFINVVPNLGKEKDYSDYFKSLTNKEEFKKLKELFN